MLVLRNAVAEAVKAAFSGRARAELIEALLYRALTPELGQAHLVLNLDDALSIDTAKEKVAIEVATDGTITVTRADQVKAARNPAA